jgi:multidrug resistance protein
MKNKSPLFILFVTIFIDLLGFGLVIPILPVFSKELHASAIEIGLIAGLYSLMNFIFAPFWGTLSDKIGRRPVMLISITITTFAYLFFAFTHSLTMLVISRIFAGIGSANISAAQAYISDITEPQDRAKNMGLLGAAFGLGFIFGPPVGGYLKAISGNGSVALVGYFAAALCAINLVMAYLWLPESIKEKQPHKAFRFKPIHDIFIAIKRPVLNELYILNFVYITAFAMMQITAAILWIEHYFLNEKEVGFVFMFIGLISAILQGGFVGKLNKTFGEKKLLFIGGFSMITGLLIIPYVPLNHFWLMFVSMTFIAFSNACITPAITSLISQSAKHGEQGQALGMNQSFGSLARVAGPALGGFLYQLHFSLPYLGGSALMVICILLSRHLAKQKASI